MNTDYSILDKLSGKPELLVEIIKCDRNNQKASMEKIIEKQTYEYSFAIKMLLIAHIQMMFFHFIELDESNLVLISKLIISKNVIKEVLMELVEQFLPTKILNPSLQMENRIIQYARILLGDDFENNEKEWTKIFYDKITRKPLL